MQPGETNLGGRATEDGGTKGGSESFAHHRAAALALLAECPGLSHMEAGFLGHVCVSATLTDKQREWLQKLLRRNDLPPVAQ
jgi:hypothetical protein